MRETASKGLTRASPGSRRYKLIERFDDPGELYDLTTDPQERENRCNDPSLADVQRTLAHELKRRFRAHTRPGLSGWEQPVTGYGQIHPVSRGHAGADSYAQTSEPIGPPI